MGCWCAREGVLVYSWLTSLMAVMMDWRANLSERAHRFMTRAKIRPYAIRRSCPRLSCRLCNCDIACAIVLSWKWRGFVCVRCWGIVPWKMNRELLGRIETSMCLKAGLMRNDDAMTIEASCISEKRRWKCHVSRHETWHRWLQRYCLRKKIISRDMTMNECGGIALAHKSSQSVLPSREVIAKTFPFWFMMIRFIDMSCGWTMSIWWGVW